MAILDPTVVPHIHHIREALWRNQSGGLASVMVGAGFSRNAQPAVMGARSFPLWDQLANEMANEIGLADGKSRDPLQIAQMYASIRGRMELSRLIERSVPDGEYLPGQLHRRLLALPWADVFTTNYDTLLERAAGEVFERNYEVIRAPSDVPMRCQPRLVKLHGTLGTGQQLIATEEDYRQYRHTHPTFINLVRSSVMETVFVLIGFAGDDPNFLEWTGWVRDILGTQAPKIYLCGLLDPAPALHALLRGRQVTPVDLSNMFPADLGAIRHVKALDWLLSALESGKPGRPENWAPVEAVKITETDVPLPPVRMMTVFSGSLDRKGGTAETPDEFRQVTEIWRAQRTEYPGWHLAPNPIRERVWWATKNWRTAVFFHADNLPLADRLHLARELCWRMELCLSPIFTHETDRLVGWLESVNPWGSRMSLPSAEPQHNPHDARLAESWVALALQVLRTAREDLDSARFSLWYGRLLSVCEFDTSVIGILRYEQVMWHLTALELSEFRNALHQWRSQAHQPIELLRLACFYAELDDRALSIELALAALNGARSHGRTAESVSVEAWSCLLLDGLQRYDDSRRGEWRERLNDAKNSGYNPWEIIQSYQHDLKEVRPKPVRSKQKIPGFGSGEFRINTRYGMESEEVMPAFQLLRLIENAPCPIHAGYLDLLGEASARAAVWIDTAAPFWSLTILLRARAKPEIVHEHFDRATIAILPESRIDALFQSLLKVLTGEIHRISSNSGQTADALGIGMATTAAELLSRVILRVAARDLELLLESVVGWIANDAVVAHFHESMELLTKRIIDVLPTDSMPRATEVLLDAPIPDGANSLTSTKERRPDLFDCLWKRPETFSGRRSPKWSANWEKVLDGIQSRDQELRSDAFHRGQFLFARKWLNDDEVEQFDQAVWSQVDPGSELPLLNGFHLQVFLHLPKKNEHGLPEKIRRKILSITFPSWETDKNSISLGTVDEVRNIFAEMCRIFEHSAVSKPGCISLVLSPSDAENFALKVLDWWPRFEKLINRVRPGPGIFGCDVEGLAKTVYASIEELLFLYLPIGHRLIPDLQERLEVLKAWGIPMGTSSVGTLFQNNGCASLVTAQVEKNLVSGDEVRVRSGLRTVLGWHRAASAQILPPLPNSIIQLLLARLALRHRPLLGWVIDCLIEIIEHEFELISSDQRIPMFLALEAIADETSPQVLLKLYDEGEIDRVGVSDGLFLRAKAAALCSTLAKVLGENVADLAVLDIWRKICREDTLPEVKRAWATV